MEMLKIFKNYSTKTSILDDFEYYEDREKAIRDKKSRLHAKQQPLPRVGAQIDSKKSDSWHLSTFFLTYHSLLISPRRILIVCPISSIDFCPIYK